MRYQYFTTGNKIICVSHFAGKSVRGVAKCAPNDEFNEEVGQELARKRCDKKVAMLRYNRAVKLYDEAIEARDAAERKLDKREDYLNDAEDEFYAACDDLADFMADMGN